MFQDVEERIKRKNTILFSRDSACLQELIQLILLQDHRALVMWAFECVKEPLAKVEAKYPNEKRPRIAVERCREWARGEIKIPIAKKAILDCHAVAKDIEDPVCRLLCHGIGQGLATVHVETHAIGLVLYELSSIVVENHFENYEEPVTQKISQYLDCLKYFEKNKGYRDLPWAYFLVNDNHPNKERILFEKRHRENKVISGRKV